MLGTLLIYNKMETRIMGEKNEEEVDDEEDDEEEAE